MENKYKAFLIFAIISLLFYPPIFLNSSLAFTQAPKPLNQDIDKKQMEEDEKLLQEALVLAKQKDSRAFDALSNLIQNESGSIRREALRGLGQTEDRRAIISGSLNWLSGSALHLIFDSCTNADVNYSIQ